MLLPQLRLERKRYSLSFFSNQFLLINGQNANVCLKPNSVKVIKSDSKQKIFFPEKSVFRSFFSGLSSALRGFGHFVEIRTEGVGFKFLRFPKAPNLLQLSLGFGHLIFYRIPESVKFRVLKTRLLLFSNDRSILSITARRLRGYRPPDPYKGKGLKYASEILKFKPGKQRQR